MEAIHYKGDGAAIGELIGGQVPIMFASIASLLPHAKAGKLRGLAITGSKRSTIAPEYPTIQAEQYAAFLREENLKWGKMVRSPGLKAQ